MKILVTGSNGTLGKPLVQELNRRGHEVFGLDLKHSNNPRELRCDISEIRQILVAFERMHDDFSFSPDVVLNLAAEFGRINGEEFYEKCWKSNVIGMRNLLEVQKRLGFKMIHASSSEIYGDLTAEYITEDMEHGRLHNDYAISKLVNEMQIKNFRDRYQNQIEILRFFNAYGPGENFTNYRSVCCLFCYQALHDIPFTVYKDYHRVFMYIDDFIPTLANACERFKDGEVINIGGTEYRSVEDLARIVLKCAGKPESLMVLKEIDKHNVTNKRPVIEKAKKLLNHDPKITLEEGIEKTIEWMRGVYGK
jgi:dTDP-glucose 4,6-dehydratase